jgi:chorismate mutase
MRQKQKDRDGMKQTDKSPAAIRKLRQQFDVVDNQIIRLLSRRFQLSRRMGILKRKTGTSIIDTGREKQIFERLLHKTRGSMLDPQMILGIWKNIIKKSYQIQRQVNNGKKNQTD